MNLSFLSFLGEGWFVVPWYIVGAFGALFLIYDIRNKNTVLKPAIAWGWPIVVLFFSVIGLALYFATARAPGMDRIRNQKEKKKAHNLYEDSMWRRVNGAVIHCVAGDGFGIMTAMVLARAAGMNFWQEFWFEYAVGFLIGWLLFQRKSMTMMTDNLFQQLAMAFRGEFFSMLTVMGGMGAVMTLVTPLVATAQPKPLTFAFWGFGMFGLLVGYVFTFPMNWMMVKLGWKHGMGSMEGTQKWQVKSAGGRAGLITAMSVLGFVGLALPAWLTQVRERAPIADLDLATTPSQIEASQALLSGLSESLDSAVQSLSQGKRTQASLAVDDALRVAEVGAHSAPGSFYHSLQQIQKARLEIQKGRESRALQNLEDATKVLRPAASAIPPLLDPSAYKGAKVIDQKGEVIGEVTKASNDTLEISLGGWRDVWGFLDLSTKRRVQVPVGSLAYGPLKAVGSSLVLLPSEG